ncbi:MAG: V-type ATP synthase subunit D [Caldiserica bacterium]|nr:V-type ATP synthase subunit D [Caldisericota bacterium]
MIRYNPTRMELLRLKKRVTLAKRGHELLRDKLDELVKEFIQLVRKEEKLRSETEERFLNVLNKSIFAGSLLSREERESLLEPLSFPVVSVEEKRVMNVKYAHFTPQEDFTPYLGGNFSPIVYEEIREDMQKLLPLFLELGEVERGIVLLGEEIVKTRRKVNALEHRFIPELEKAIKYISFKLQELEKEAITRLMKIKEKIRGE